MALKLMYITNDQEVARIAEKSGVDWIFVDLEINGKKERQAHLDTVISHHSIKDVRKIRQVLTKSELIVRINPIYEGTKDEIDNVICNGANIIMLPFFKNKDEVQEFIGLINGRCRSCLLLETPEAVENIDSVLSVNGIDYVHIGLNDLHLGYNMMFMFELLADGTIEMLCNKIKQKNIVYGFGGIAQIGQGMLKAENIIAEHYRLSSSLAILSRSFCDMNTTKNLKDVNKLFAQGISNIRRFENMLVEKSKEFYEVNQREIKHAVSEIVAVLATGIV
ncbi:MAG: HpcH/HpaI aldolase/citrate lyase family protein [Firmicutes bacterium]|nr:HpcH/HpaI aldolase/citrate lyase family protein [Bacillota bacterium]